MQIEVLGERYQLQDPIGRGGMATIYRGRDLRMDRTVAIKVLREVYSTDPKFVTRFQREAKAASALQHPNIVQVYDYGQSDGNYFIVMELIEGTDLRRYLRSRGVLAIDRAIIIAHDIALGLGAAHRRQIVHRDVKPQNILVGRDGSIKLTDFGIASVYKDINAERLTTTGMTLGTVQYYAPEQAQGEIVNPAADVYALGIVMYEMLTGRTPFDGDTPVAVAMQHIQDAPQPPSQLNPNIPPLLEDIILRCLEKIPEMRYRDGNTLARALEVLGEEAIGVASGAPGSQQAPPMNGFSTAGPTVPPRPTSSPNHRMAPMQNPAAENLGTRPGAPGGAVVLPPVAGVPGGTTFPPLPIDQDATTRIEQQQIPYSSPIVTETAETRPFRKDDLRSDHESRIASIVTIAILFTTVLLLGFSVYLAGELGLLPPIFGQQTTQQNADTSKVPSLIGMTYAQAKTAAEQVGFKLQVDGSQTGQVKTQDPLAGEFYKRGSTITVKMTGTDSIKVPPLVGLTLTEAKQKLQSEGIQSINVEVDTLDPQDATKGNDIVTRCDPEEGTTIQPTQTVTLYVTNYTQGQSTPTQTAPTQTAPTQVPTVAPTPTPTTAPTPTPTTAPTPTPTTAPTSTGSGG